MTLEILMINPEEILMGADSQVTVDFNTTHAGKCKIFEINENLAMGMMFYGSAYIEEIPYEVLIEDFKRKHEFKKTDTIDTIKEEFIDYLRNNTSSLNLDDFIDIRVEEFIDEIRIYLEDMDSETDNLIDLSSKSDILPIIKQYRYYDTVFDELYLKILIKRKLVKNYGKYFPMTLLKVQQALLLLVLTIMNYFRHSPILTLLEILMEK